MLQAAPNLQICTSQVPIGIDLIPVQIGGTVRVLWRVPGYEQ